MVLIIFWHLANGNVLAFRGEDPRLISLITHFNQYIWFSSLIYIGTRGIDLVLPSILAVDKLSIKALFGKANPLAYNG